MRWGSAANQSWAMFGKCTGGGNGFMEKVASSEWGWLIFHLHFHFHSAFAFLQIAFLIQKCQSSHQGCWMRGAPCPQQNPTFGGWKAARAGAGSLKTSVVLAPLRHCSPPSQPGKGIGVPSNNVEIRLVPAGFGLEVGNGAKFPSPWLDGMETETPQQVHSRLFHLKDEKKGEKNREKELLSLNN